MGKGKKGKKVDLEKKAALQAKKEAKQEKSARKRLSKQQQQQQQRGGSGNGDGTNIYDDEEELDQVLQAYKSRDKKQVDAYTEKAVLENLETTFPLPRANATLEYCSTDKKDYFYLFGGEYFDGVENIVLDDILRFDVTKKEWKQILTSPKPNARCAHSCVAYKNCLYVFGGELATADQYHHYKDLWKFDVTTMKWTEIKAKNPPSARSGHVCFVWKSYMILFGGFFEALRETKWYNDVHVFNLQTETWMTDIVQSRLATKPDPRSGCNLASFGTDKIVIHGGFSKLKTSASSSLETKVHSDAWILHLGPILQKKPPTWERWMSSSKGTSSTSPSGRAGTSSISYKDRMLVYGGVVDDEQQNHKVASIFYNDLMAMDIERRKWFPLRVKKASAGGGTRRRKKSKNDDDGNDDDDDNDDDNNNDKMTDEDNDHDESFHGSDLEEEEENEDDGAATDTGWGLDMLRANMFAFVDGDGNIIYEKIEDDDDGDEDHQRKNDGAPHISEEKVEEEEEEEEKEEEKEDDEEKEEEEKEEEKAADKLMAKQPSKKHGTEQGQVSKKITSSSVMVLNPETNAPEAVERMEPLPRINASMLLHGHSMYLLGGILEVGDREVTLDDMWSLDLRKRDKWECYWPGTMHKQVWRGAVHDDDDSYISTGKEDGDDDDDDDYDDASDFDDDDDDDGEEKNDIGMGEAGEKKDKKMKKKSSTKSASLRQEIAQLNETYNLDDDNRTPKNNESLADFYSRTSSYWNAYAAQRIGTNQVSSSSTTPSDNNIINNSNNNSEQLSNKELKREGFKLAKERYEELKPVLDRLAELSIGTSTGTTGSPSGNNNNNNNKSDTMSDRKKDEKKSKKEKKSKRNK